MQELDRYIPWTATKDSVCPIPEGFKFTVWDTWTGEDPVHQSWMDGSTLRHSSYWNSEARFPIIGYLIHKDTT